MTQKVAFKERSVIYKTHKTHQYAQNSTDEAGGVREEIVIPPPLVRDSSAERFDRRPAPNVRGGWRPKSRWRPTRCLSGYLEAKNQGKRLFKYVVPSCFNN